MITADANTPHQAVVRAMDAAGQLGFVSLSITTLDPKKQ
jgi:biopolymer transport protein ExbD